MKLAAQGEYSEFKKLVAINNPNPILTQYMWFQHHIWVEDWYWRCVLKPCGKDEKDDWYCQSYGRAREKYSSSCSYHHVSGHYLQSGSCTMTTQYCSFTA